MGLMRSRVLRSLVLACSLLLALPQGCVCLFAVLTATATVTTATTTPVTTGGCCGCYKQDRQPKPTPTGKPSAPPVSRCPCYDRQALPSSKSPVEQPDAGFAIIAVH